MLNPQLLKKIKEDPGGVVGSIEYLDLSSSNLRPADLQLLTKALNGHVTHFNGVCSPIMGINLSNNNLCNLNHMENDENGLVPEHKAIQGFCKSLQNHRYIRILNLGEIILGAPGFKALFDLLETTTSLHELILSGCETTPQIMADFGVALTKNKSLTHLDLTETGMTPEGLESLLTALCDTYRSEVKSLLIGGNNLGPDGARKLARALLRPPRALLAVNAESNGFGDAGARSLCRALRANKTLQHLDLSDNNFSQDSGTEFAIALTKNTTLLFLSVSWNNLNAGGLQKLVPGLQNNTSLKYLNIIGNGGGPEVGTALLEASLLSSATPVDIDIDCLPARSRQEIIKTDTKTVISTDDAEDDAGDAEDRPFSGGGSARRRTSSTDPQNTPSSPLAR